MKKIAYASTALVAALLSMPAQALTLTENFDAVPFSGWQTRWFGENTNATPFLFDPNDRGNNGTGLTIFDGNLDDGRKPTILFDADFGARITNFSFDLLNYTTGLEQVLSVFDIGGNLLKSFVLPVVATGPQGPFDFAQDDYTPYSVDSTNGIGSLSIGPFGSEGNVSIDNLSVTLTAIPEPATWAMMISGFGLAGASLRRRRFYARASA